MKHQAKWNHKIFVLLGLGVLCIFALIQYGKQNQNRGFFVDQGIVFIKTDAHHVFSFGDVDTVQSKMLNDVIQHFFSTKITPMESFEGDQIRQAGLLKIKKMSENIVWIEQEKKRIWILKNPTEKEKKEIQKKPFRLIGDIVLLQSDDVEIFSEMPSKIIYWGAGKGEKKLRKRAEKEGKSFISVRKEGVLSFNWDQEHWNLKTKK
jgi:hypothetical protein